MVPTGSPSADTDALFVVRSLLAQLEAAQLQHTQEREADRVQHAREREADRREIRRLVAMVEGLTRQLDEALAAQLDEMRAERARLRAEAQAAAAAAAAATAAERAATTEPSAAAVSSPGSSSESETPPKRHPHGRAKKPADVERDRQVLMATVCPKCGLKHLRGTGRRTEPIEEWDYVRPHVRLRSTEREESACEDCGTLVPPPPPPPMPFDRASCTFPMMAWLCYSRCALFLPLDRMLKEFAAAGARIPSATGTRWWVRGTDLLLPIVGAVRLSLLADSHMGTDGTGLQVVFPRVKGSPRKGPDRPGATDDNGFLLPREPLDGQILVFGNDEHAVYVFTPTREGHHALDFLTVGQDQEGHPIRWRGTITADALSAQDCLFEGEGRKEGGCNSHGLRKFRDDADKAPLLASRAMAFIGRIYDVEGEGKAKGLRGPALLTHRQTFAKPVVNDFRAWLDDHIADLLPKNPIRKAMQYYLNHWQALTLFLTDPEVPLDNNWSERALRIVALLRNNSLYAGGEDGAERLCTMFTLIHTCRLLGLDPYEYIVWALTRSVPHPDNRGLAAVDLTPAAYKALLAPTAKTDTS